MAILGILFDKDGTLIDYEKTWPPINFNAARYAARGDPALTAELLRRTGQDPATGRVAAGSVLATGSVEDIAREFAIALGRSTPPDLAQAIERIFSDGGARGAVLIPGVAATLRELKRRGLRMGVGSNDSQRGLHASLSAPGVLEFFAFAAGYDSGFGSKPDRRMALAFCRAVGIAPNEMAVVGDARLDLAMGRAAGAGLTVGVLSGTSARGELEELADLIIDSVNDLVLLDAFRGRAASDDRAQR